MKGRTYQQAIFTQHVNTPTCQASTHQNTRSSNFTPTSQPKVSFSSISTHHQHPPSHLLRNSVTTSTPPPPLQQVLRSETNTLSSPPPTPGHMTIPGRPPPWGQTTTGKPSQTASKNATTAQPGTRPLSPVISVYRNITSARATVHLGIFCLLNRRKRRRWERVI
jgi:hypothetical protein